jgi:hypothetical protein
MKVATHRQRSLPDAEVAHRAFLQRLADLLRLHGLATAEVGEDVVAGLDAALANEVDEAILVGQVDEVLLVMGQRHPGNGGDDPDGGGGEEDGQPEGDQDVHSIPLGITCLPGQACIL